MSDAVVDALRLGKAMERESIVAWLRSKEEMVEVYVDTDGENSWRILSGSTVADLIEHGEHLRSDDE